LLLDAIFVVLLAVGSLRFAKAGMIFPSLLGVAGLGAAAASIVYSLAIAGAIGPIAVVMVSSLPFQAAMIGALAVAIGVVLRARRDESVMERDRRLEGPKEGLGLYIAVLSIAAIRCVLLLLGKALSSG
jgi:hypothetical protein